MTNEPLETNERNKELHWLTASDYILIILLILVIAVVLAGIFVFKDYSKSCVANPLVYGVQQLSKANDNEFVYCTCTKPSNGMTMYITENGTTIKDNLIP